MRVRSTESALAEALMAEPRVAMVSEAPRRRVAQGASSLWFSWSCFLLALADGVPHQLELGRESRLRRREVAAGTLHGQEFAIEFDRVAVAPRRRVLDFVHLPLAGVGGIDVIRARG